MTVQASDIALFLETALNGSELAILGPRSLSSAEHDTIVFMSKPTEETVARLNRIGVILCVTTDAIADQLTCATIAVDAPRLAFAKTLNKFFAPKLERRLAPEASIDANAQISASAIIGPGCHISAGVKVGNNAIIGSNVVILGTVKIGKHCVIKSNTTIGEPGFGFVRTSGAESVRFPHLGQVNIGDHVEIGANCTVARATLDATVLEDHVKLDDHVHIAHNCHVGSGAFIAAGAVLSGSVHLGRNVWISPNATIIDYCKVGEDAFVGIGSVVTKPVADSTRVFGVPARPIGSQPRRKT